MRKTSMLRTLAVAAAMSAPLFATMGSVAVAAAYPDKPVKIIVTYPPGGSTDTITRLIGHALSEKWGQPVVVENKGGASGMIGTVAAARSPADGYSLVMNGSGPVSINVSLFQNIEYDPVKDFEPIIQTTVLPLLMVTQTNAPYSSVSEFIAWANENTGKVNYCSIGPGSPSHLAAELFLSSTKIEMTHVPYKGSGPALVDTMAGICHVMFDSALSAGPHVSSGKLKLLGVGTDSRLAAWPSVPAVAETVSGFSAYSWTALMAPAGVPDEVIRKINADTAAVLADPEIIAKLEAQGAIPGKGSPEDLAAFIQSEIDKWAKVIAEGNITVN